MMKPRRAAKPLGAVLGHGELGISLIFIFPLFLIYEIGVIFAPHMNGVDFVSRNVYELLGYSRALYLVTHMALGLMFLLLVLWLRRRRSFQGRFLTMLLESTVFSLTLGSFIWFVMRKLLGIDPELAWGGLENAAVGTVLSLGAGVHEELIFRLGFLSGGAALARVAGVSHRLAVTLAFVISSILFSAAHHIGAGGDPWSLQLFIYRSLAGIVFGALYYFRSLAHATYTHALYDVYVLVLR